MLIDDFYTMILEDARNAYSSGIYRSTEEAVEGIVSNYLEEEQIVKDIQFSPFKKSPSARQEMRVSAYAFDEANATLFLIVVKTDLNNKIARMSRNDANRMLKMVRRFYRNAKKGMHREMEETDSAFTLAQLIFERQDYITTVRVLLASNALLDMEPPADSMEEDTLYSYDIWDIDRIFRIAGQVDTDLEHTIDLKAKYELDLCMMKMLAAHQKYDCYVGMIPGETLAQIYEEYGLKLIERNVRSFLQAKNAINKGIRDTVRDEPEMFVAYNNGISTIASWIEYDERGNGVVSLKRLHGWQIVNGGQTTATLANAYKANNNLKEVFVPIKLTVLKSGQNKDKIISCISKYANSQNKITMSDFSANNPWHIEMEKLSRNIWAPSRQRIRWFYERARGQYLVELNRQNTVAKKKKFRNENPKSHFINKTLVAKCLMCSMQFPHIVSKGSETNFVRFMEFVEAGEVPFPNERFYKHAVANVILFDKCDRIVKNLHLGDYKANVVAYTIALAYRMHKDKIDLDAIWANQDINLEVEVLLRELAQNVWSHITSPLFEGTNITQWCKREECWHILLQRQGLESVAIDEDEEDD